MYISEYSFPTYFLPHKSVTYNNSIRFTCSGAGAGAGVGVKDIGGDGGDLPFCAYADVEHKSTSVLQTMNIMVFSIDRILKFLKFKDLIVVRSGHINITDIPDYNLNCHIYLKRNQFCNLDKQPV